jgi:diguanylate cyclase
MTGEVETLLRGPTAFAVSRKAMDQMEAHGVWPTPLNFELWIYFVAAPESELGREIARMIKAGEPFTDMVSDELAAHYLPKAKLNEQIRDAGDALSRELASVSEAITSAKKSSEAYGRTLAHAGKVLDVGQDLGTLKSTVQTLSAATDRMAQENKALEARLAESTEEVARLREHLEQVRRDATTDGLTNLANRKAFDDELDRAWCSPSSISTTSRTSTTPGAIRRATRCCASSPASSAATAPRRASPPATAAKSSRCCSRASGPLRPIRPWRRSGPRCPPGC